VDHIGEAEIPQEKAMRPQKRRKDYWEMTTAELREATKEFETGDGGPALKPSPQELAQLERARQKKPGRPRVGKGARRVSVSIEGQRLKHIDEQARRLGISRSEFIARG
jgi:hypothetical protein